MPCPKCKNKRVFRYSEVVCPTCQGIKIFDSPAEITQRRTSLQESLKYFEELLLECNQASIFDVAIKRREDISARIISDVWVNLGEIEQWQALRYLIGKCDRNKKSGSYSEQILDQLQAVSFEIVTMKNEIDKLQKNQALIIEAEKQKGILFDRGFSVVFYSKKC